MIKKILTPEKASRLALIFTGLLIALHLLVIIGVLPFHRLWTELPDPSAVLPLELITIVANFSLILLVLIKMKHLERGEKSLLLGPGLYLVVLILLARAVFKTISPAPIDHFVIGPILLLLAILTLRLAIEK